MEPGASSAANSGREQVPQPVWIFGPNGNNNTVFFTYKVRMKSDYT